MQGQIFAPMFVIVNVYRICRVVNGQSAYIIVACYLQWFNQETWNSSRLIPVGREVRIDVLYSKHMSIYNLSLYSGFFA